MNLLYTPWIPLGMIWCGILSVSNAQTLAPEAGAEAWEIVLDLNSPDTSTQLEDLDEDFSRTLVHTDDLNTEELARLGGPLAEQIKNVHSAYIDLVTAMNTNLDPESVRGLIDEDFRQGGVNDSIIKRHLELAGAAALMGREDMSSYAYQTIGWINGESLEVLERSLPGAKGFSLGIAPQDFASPDSLQSRVDEILQPGTSRPFPLAGRVLQDARGGFALPSRFDEGQPLASPHSLSPQGYTPFTPQRFIPSGYPGQTGSLDSLLPGRPQGTLSSSDPMLAGKNPTLFKTAVGVLVGEIIKDAYRESGGLDQLARSITDPINAQRLQDARSEIKLNYDPVESERQAQRERERQARDTQLNQEIDQLKGQESSVEEQLNSSSQKLNDYEHERDVARTAQEREKYKRMAEEERERNDQLRNKLKELQDKRYDKEREKEENSREPDKDSTDQIPRPDGESDGGGQPGGPPNPYICDSGCDDSGPRVPFLQSHPFGVPAPRPSLPPLSIRPDLGALGFKIQRIRMDRSSSSSFDPSRSQNENRFAGGIQIRVQGRGETLDERPQAGQDPF